MSGIVISGYASLDHVVVLGGDISMGQTTTILHRRDAAWPRLGGGPAYVAQAIIESFNGAVYPLSWVGADQLGDVYLRQLADQGVSCIGMAKVAGARTPVSVLAYIPGGDCAVLYDSGLPAQTRLNDQQMELVRQAEWICITIGPTNVTNQLLSTITSEQKLAWIVKNDPNAIQQQQTAALAGRADIIFCNAKERPFLEAALGAQSTLRSGQIIIETQGRRGAVFIRAGSSTYVTCEAVDVVDPTGAGDTFAGGVIAAMMNGETTLDQLGRSGSAAVHKLLTARRAEEMGS